MVNRLPIDAPYYRTLSETPSESDDETHEFPSTSLGMAENAAEEEFFGNKNFEQLTEEEKSLLPPGTMAQKETEYQRRLIGQLPVYYPGLSGCRKLAEEYEYLNDIAEGTYGVVFRAQNKRTDEIVALKLLKLEKECHGFPITSLREINMLLKCGQHENVVNVREVVVDDSNLNNWAVCLVMEYIEQDLKSLMDKMIGRGKKWTIAQIKTLLKQLLSGIGYLHSEFVIHRDLKASNLLLTNQGILKIGDFGMAREFGDPVKRFTPVVCTLWYRSPEILLGTKYYSTPADIWSVGCIFGELLKMAPLFPGRSEIDQLQKIFVDLGAPNEECWPGCTELAGMKQAQFGDGRIPSGGGGQLRRKFTTEFGTNYGGGGFMLFNSFLQLDPSKRPSADDALKSQWFEEEPKPAHPSSFPTWPAKGEEQRRTNSREQQRQQQPAGDFTLKFDVSKF